MNIRLAVLFPLFAGLGACMMPMQPAQQGGTQQGGTEPSGGTGPGTIGAPPPSSAGDPSGAQGSNGSSGPAAPAGPQTASVTIRSSCPKTVKVFYGDKPKFGSGTYSSVESNSVSSHTFNAGDMFWIVDDSQNGVASVTVNPGMNQIEVASDCTHLSAH